MEKQIEVKSQIEAQKSGLLVGSNLEEQYRIAKYYLTSKLLPARFDTAEKILVAMQMCYELNLKPLTGMRQIAVINGTPTIYGDLPLALVQASGKLESNEEFFLDESGMKVCAENKNLTAEVFGACCAVKRVGQPEKSVYFMVSDAKIAGLWNKKGRSGEPTPWVLYPRRMLQCRARAQALKDAFPDILNGIQIAEYDLGLDAVTIEKNHGDIRQVTQADLLNNEIEAQKPIILKDLIDEAEIIAKEES